MHQDDKAPERELLDIGLARVDVHRLAWGASDRTHNRSSILHSIPELQRNTGRALVACSLWLHVGFIGALALAAGLHQLFDGQPQLWDLALAISGGVLAAASWRRGRTVLEHAERLSGVDRPRAPLQAGQTRHGRHAVLYSAASEPKAR